MVIAWGSMSLNGEFCLITEISVLELGKFTDG